MSVRIVYSGILDTLQDMGRTGYGAWGINPGGVMDRFAARAANALVGNASDQGVIEMHFPAAHYTFETDCLIGLAGADFKPHCNSVAVSGWKPLLMQKGDTLSFKGKIRGSRCYMAIHGGFNADPWLGSVSTNLKVGIGGVAGRALKKGDVLTLHSGLPDFLRGRASDVRSLPWSVSWEEVYGSGDIICFTEGREWRWLTDAAQQLFIQQLWRIDPRSDRMGYYLAGEALVFQERHELLSSGVNFGTIQALPDGGMVILMADHQTTGGYPRVAHITSAHLPKLAQLGGGDQFRLYRVDLDEAEKMLLSQQARIDRIVRSCFDKLETYGQAHRS